MKTSTDRYQIELITKMLGTVPKNKEVYTAHIASKAVKSAKPEGLEVDGKKVVDPDEEIETVEDIEEKGWTGFHQDEDGLFIYSYMILGFLKTACQVLIENKAINKISAYKSWLDKLVFVYPRRIYFGKMKPDGELERPLRAMTRQGPRVTVTRSDYIDAGQILTFDIEIINNSKKIDHDLLEQLFKYGQYQGLGQWRGSGRYGQFKLLPAGAKKKKAA